MKYRLIRSLLLFLCLFLYASLAQAELKPGTEVPDFELDDMAGETVRLSDYKGHPFILKLATTWCPSCREQSAEFSKAKSFLADNRIPVIEVFIDDAESDVREYISKNPLPEPNASIIDDGTVYEAYNIYVIPRVLIVDGDFRVVRDGSLIRAAEFRPILQELL